MKSKDTAIKKVKGFSSAYPNICDLKLLPNIDGNWITIQDDVGTSMTIRLSDLSDFICCEISDDNGGVKNNVLELHLLNNNEKIMLNIDRINSVYQEGSAVYVYIGEVVYRVKETYGNIVKCIKKYYKHINVESEDKE